VIVPVSGMTASPRRRASRMLRQMCTARHDIERLMYRYCTLIDAGDFAGVAELFADADHISSSGHTEHGAAGVLSYLERRTRRFPETGTPRTKHVTANVDIEIDPSETAAVAHSSFIVFQAVPGHLALQPIVAGRYEDRFVRTSDGWQFSERRKFVELEGELEQHLAWTPAG